MVFCGLDIGTTNTKAVVLGSDGRLLDRVTIPSRRQRKSGDEATVTWYEHFCRALDYFAPKGHLVSQEIFCSVTGQGGSFVLLNDSFKPLSRIYKWTENADTNIVADLIKALDKQRYYHITGWQPDAWLAACKLRQLVHRKKISKHLRFIATVPDFIYSQMTGQMITDITSAQITGICDFRKGRWSHEILNWIGVKDNLLPSITKESAILFDKVSTRWGKISFVTGSHDQYAAMQAAGLQKDKSIMLGTGTAWVINGRAGKPVFDDNNFLIHPGRDLYKNSFGYIITLRQIGGGFDKLLRRFDVGKKRLARIEASFQKQDLPNEPVKIDISNGTTEPQLDVELAVRRFMEWAASLVAFVLEKSRLNKGLDRIVITGGAMSSRFWPQVIADLCNITVEAVDFPEFTAYGAALHAEAAVKGIVLPHRLPQAVTSRTYLPQQSKQYRKWYRNCQQPILETLPY